MTGSMFKQVAFYGSLNERTGFGVHASRLIEQLSKLVNVNFNGVGDVHLSLLDVVTASQTKIFPPHPSILYTVWESTQYPDQLVSNLKNYDRLWVPSKWQKDCNVAQGIPESFIDVVPEGVDPSVFHPFLGRRPHLSTFDFLHVGQWQPRKSTIEICQSFLRAFPRNQDVRLYLSADTLFPSDDCKSTEERLERYGLLDPRIIPIHFESREAYVRRLQSVHCFVTCARSEGWNLPLIEAMACGVPAISSEFGGSTEYAGGGILVPIRKLIEPFGIYGNWDVPGEWAEPDWNVLVDLMRKVYENHDFYSRMARLESTRIRKKFSWESAARKAYKAMSATLPSKPSATLSKKLSAKSVPAPASPRRVLFSIDTHPTSPEKLSCLMESIQQVKECGYPVLVVSHVPLPESVIFQCDYYIYDKRDILSWGDMPEYWRRTPEGKIETTKSSIPCHALAGLHNVRNAIDFCLGAKRWDWLYHMCYDTEIDLPEVLEKFNASTKDFISTHWDNNPLTCGGQICAGKIESLDKLYPRLETWDEYRNLYGDQRFSSEYFFYTRANEILGASNIEYLDIQLGNRFDQVDRDAWPDDMFQCNFIGGPYLLITGISKRVYDVFYNEPIDGNNYTLKQIVGEWSRPNKKYYADWTITAKLDGKAVFTHHLNFAGKNVMVSMESKALGDTLAWIPYVSEFQKKHGCIVHCSTWWNAILDYPNIHFCTPGDTLNDVYASYDVGCFDEQPDKNVTNWRLTPLQKVAADILGLEYIPLRAKLKYDSYIPVGNGHLPKPYICFSEFSTMQNKFWNREGGWQKVIDYLTILGFDCVSISNENSKLSRIVNHCGQSIEQSLTDMSGAKFYIGLNHGPSWIAYSMGIPVIMIDGVAEKWNSFPTPYRVAANVGCKPCFNNTSIPIDRSWDWCINPSKYACTKDITPEMVIDKINTILGMEKVSIKRIQGISKNNTKHMEATA
jgi:autotransporter strand-loop-strand O-heptosyltransferase